MREMQKYSQDSQRVKDGPHHAFGMIGFMNGLDGSLASEGVSGYQSSVHLGAENA